MTDSEQVQKLSATIERARVAYKELEQSKAEAVGKLNDELAHAKDKIQELEKSVDEHAPESIYSATYHLFNDQLACEKQFTVRGRPGETGLEFLAREKVMFEKLLKDGWHGIPPRQSGNGNGAGTPPQDGEAPICAIHKEPMQKRQGRNGSFWSCPKKLEDGSWCPYKPTRK